MKKLAAVALIVITCAGCMPRGESRSLQEILDTARLGFQSVAGNATGASAATVQGMVADLDKLAGFQGTGEVSTSATKVADALDSLVSHANYTARPAMGELINQYRSLSASKAVTVGAPQAKLLVARTYTLLKSELSTTKFGI